MARLRIAGFTFSISGGTRFLKRLHRVSRRKHAVNAAASTITEVEHDLSRIFLARRTFAGWTVHFQVHDFVLTVSWA